MFKLLVQLLDVLLSMLLPPSFVQKTGNKLKSVLLPGLKIRVMTEKRLASQESCEQRKGLEQRPPITPRGNTLAAIFARKYK